MEQGCPHRSILPHIFPDCNSFAIKIGGKFCGVRGVCPGGGLPRRCRRGGRQRYPAGGVPALSPANPAFNLFPCPHPPDPLPGGKGVTIGYFFARGFAPCIPGAEPGRHWFALPLWKTQWGACLLCRLPALPLWCPRGACLLCRLPALPLRCPRGSVPALSPAYPAFRFLFCPLSPRPPSPVGKGVTIGYFMQGASPLAFPGLNPRGTGSPCHCGKLNGGACPGVAGSAGVSGTRRGACLLCRLPTLPLWCPRGACLLCRLLTLP